MLPFHKMYVKSITLFVLFCLCSLSMDGQAPYKGKDAGRFKQTAFETVRSFYTLLLDAVSDASSTEGYVDAMKGQYVTYDGVFFPDYVSEGNKDLVSSIENYVSTFAKVYGPHIGLISEDPNSFTFEVSDPVFEEVALIKDYSGIKVVLRYKLVFHGKDRQLFSGYSRGVVEFPVISSRSLKYIHQIAPAKSDHERPVSPKVTDNSVRSVLSVTNIVPEWQSLPDGCYGVSPAFTPVDSAAVSSECIGVALVYTRNYRKYAFMMGKRDAGVLSSWAHEYRNISALPNFNKAHKDHFWCSLPLIDGTYHFSINNLKGDLSTWRGYYALADFEGKTNSAKLVDAFIHDSESALLGETIRSFLQKEALCYGKQDWYIPSCGQMSLVYMFKETINRLLKAMGGDVLSSFIYWTSTEGDKQSAWNVRLGSGLVESKDKISASNVLFIRDLYIPE